VCLTVLFWSGPHFVIEEQPLATTRRPILALSPLHVSNKLAGPSFIWHNS